MRQMMNETETCKFFAIACYAKEKDGSLRQKDEFVGYWYCPLMGDSLKDLVHARHFSTFEEAETVCKEINNDDRFFYGKIKCYSAELNEQDIPVPVYGKIKCYSAELNEQGIRDAKGRKCKVPFTIMRHSNGTFVVVLNDYLVKGSFPSSASPVLETDVALEDLADALAISELKDMLDYRLAKIKKDQETRI